ncbi:MAG TPA: amidohydrolase family protein, partial [Terriglobales bacterium]|nr:amidohydrolase family protein [Terriglobales bacterium]
GKVAIPTGAEVIDATGKTLMPGLWDMHVHLAENDGLLHMAAGVTSVPDGMDQHYSDSFLQMLKMTRALYLAGIPIVAGTDGLAGFTLDRELELYVEAGIPAPKVLQLSTLGAARVMKMDQRLGSIAPARLADVILVDGNPASRISDIRCVETVVKDGVMYRSADLYHAANVASGNPPAN